VPISLNGLEQTLFIPLWCRAHASLHYPSLFYDPKAVELVGSVDYDFSAIEAQLNPVIRLVSVARARQCDSILKAYIAQHPRASVVDLGAGLDTAFYRVDNGLIDWYDLDLPDVIAVRKQLLPETDRVRCIARSLFDVGWCDALINESDGVFASAGAVLGYFDEVTVKKFFSALADRLPGGQMVFTAYSPRELAFINNTLTRVGMKGIAMKWALQDGDDLTRSDDRISVVDEFSFFRNIPPDRAWGEETIRTIRSIDERKGMRVVHVKFEPRKE
jgi:O-methyltransferase involved in polyketide biosynthesis